MNQKKLLATASLILASFSGYLTPSSAFAASQDECAIWICLPGGFPSGCGSAHSAMKDRLEDGKSPLPNFSSCAISGGENDSTPATRMSNDYVVAAKMPDGSLIKGTTCRVRYNYNGRNTSPSGCVGTVKYVEVFADNVLMGNRYYIQGGSNTVMWQEDTVSGQ